MYKRSMNDVGIKGFLLLRVAQSFMPTCCDNLVEILNKLLHDYFSILLGIEDIRHRVSIPHGVLPIFAMYMKKLLNESVILVFPSTKVPLARVVLSLDIQNRTHDHNSQRNHGQHRMVRIVPGSVEPAHGGSCQSHGSDRQGQGLRDGSHDGGGEDSSGHGNGRLCSGCRKRAGTCGPHGGNLLQQQVQLPGEHLLGRNITAQRPLERRRNAPDPAQRSTQTHQKPPDDGLVRTRDQTRRRAEDGGLLVPHNLSGRQADLLLKVHSLSCSPGRLELLAGQMLLNPGAHSSQRVRVREIHRDPLLQHLVLVGHPLQKLVHMSLDVPGEGFIVALSSSHHQQNWHGLVVADLLQHGGVVLQALVQRRGHVQHQMHMLGEVRSLLPVGQKLLQVRQPVVVRASAPSVRCQLQELLHRVEFGFRCRRRVRGPAAAIVAPPFQEPLHEPQSVLGRLVLVRRADRDVALVDLERQRGMAPLLIYILPPCRASSRFAAPVGAFAWREAQNLPDQRGLARTRPADNENSQSLKHVSCRQILVTGPHVRPHGGLQSVNPSLPLSPSSLARLGCELIPTTKGPSRGMPL
ncbi:hypothetical protein Mapa_015582 [Marchantia paleacea]|nr:hypothetical protein Mapa_015582 [Marchantia paleacea]